MQESEQEAEGGMQVFERCKQSDWGREQNVRILHLEEKLKKPHGKQEGEEGCRVRVRLDVDGVVPEDLGRVVLYEYQMQIDPWESQRLLLQTKGEGLLLCNRHDPYSLRDNVVPSHHSRIAGDVLLLL